MKTPALAIALLGAVTAPALAGGKHPILNLKATAPVVVKANIGEGYDLPRLDRKAKLPTEAVVETSTASKTLTPYQVSEVVKMRRDDVEYCWAGVAILDRMPCTAVLKLSVDPQGNVTSAKVGGDAPASVARCLGDAVTHWSFPTTELKSDVSYPIALRTL